MRQLASGTSRRSMERAAAAGDIDAMCSLDNNPMPIGAGEGRSGIGAQ